MSGVILLPTLNRPHLLKNFLDSYQTTEATCAMHILVDDEDYKKHQSEYDSICAVTNTGSAVTMGDKVRFIWPKIKEHKWVGLLNDDHYCITPHWDKIIEEMLDGTNMVSTNDGNWNFGFRVVGLTAWSMGLLDACGFPIFPDGLNHYFIDDTWKAIGESTGCWQETMKVNIEHRHVFNGKMPEDETFRKVNAPEATQKDLAIFKKFMEEQFQDVCKRIVALRTQQIKDQKFT